jgi:hypothetical protein
MVAVVYATTAGSDDIPRHIKQAVESSGELPLAAYGTHLEEVQNIKSMLKWISNITWNRELNGLVRLCSPGLWVSAACTLKVNFLRPDNTRKSLEEIVREIPCNTVGCFTRISLA